ncbi:MAG: type 2 isopentenyl-diphosphate Delta-isomerase [Candidatus Freyarchaeota archaeon]|nr:type 2 isopentenyl-diphosphate Delta-isomerase [Candidatus Freyrarchaeum guaymaensis]
MNNTFTTENRKLEHIKICIKENVQFSKSAGFEDVEFVHCALPEVNLDDISLDVSVFGKQLKAPIIIAAMTGGTRKGGEINRFLAVLAEEYGLGIGVGSQRAAIENKRLRETFSVVRKVAPTTLKIANIGAPQLVEGYTIKELDEIVSMIEADALAVHLNPLQEAIQPEGDTNFQGVLKKLKEAAESLEVPIIAKETGCGIAREEAVLLEEAGVKAIDVGGAGGTSWSAVEYFRRKEDELGKTFWDWGIPTVASTIEVATFTSLDVIATGGVRSGVHVAKAIALGARATGIAYPFLKYAYKEKYVEARRLIHRLLRELRVTMFLTGSRSLNDLKKTRIIVTGKTAEWLNLRGINLSVFARGKRPKNQNRKL